MTRVSVVWRGVTRTGVVAGTEYADGLPTGARFIPVTFDDTGETVPDVDTRIVFRRGVVTFHRVHFLESDVSEGDFPRDDTRTSVHDDLTAVEAARLIYRAGLTFAATGSDWAANPDGSYVSDYATGERVEESAYLSGFPDRVAVAIARAVDTGSAACR